MACLLDRGCFQRWIHDEIEDHGEKREDLKKLIWRTPKNLAVVTSQSHQILAEKCKKDEKISVHNLALLKRSSNLATKGEIKLKIEVYRRHPLLEPTNC